MPSKHTAFVFITIGTLALLTAMSPVPHARAQEPSHKPSPAACLMPAVWYRLAGVRPRALANAEALGDAARHDIVLLGEQHDNSEHHQWQIQTVAALHLLHPRLAIGFESFPRRVQPVLDQWVAGELTQQQFLERVEWNRVWGFPPELYLPLFQFARLNRVPMIALNVERTLTEDISKRGWDAIPASEKEGVSRAAAPSSEYEAFLLDVYRQHSRGKDAPAASRKDAAFQRFVQSQTTWDRAMAEALARPLRTDAESRPLVIGIMGSGHMRDGYGVPHQLRDLGVTSVASLLPIEATTPCNEIRSTLADAIFAIPASPSVKSPPPRLGVTLETREKSVAILTVTPGSLAEQSGLKAGDVITSIAGTAVMSTGRVITAVREQPAGTWLPIQVRRGDTTIDLVIKFAPKT